MQFIMQSRKNIIKRILNKFFLLALSLVFLFPVLSIVINSFMSPTEVMSVYGAENAAGFQLFPSHFCLMSYYQVFLGTPQYLIKFWKSLGMVFLILAGQMVTSCMGAAAFSHYKFKGSSLWFGLLIFFTFLPVQATLVPDYWLLSQIHLADSYWALILPNIFSPLGTVLITMIYRNVPKELLEAASLDGANAKQILISVLVPCGKPGIASFFVISFADCWNMVEQPMVFLSDPRDFPLSVFLAVMNDENLSLQFACAILCLLPITLLFLFFHEELSEGITSAITK